MPAPLHDFMQGRGLFLEWRVKSEEFRVEIGEGGGWYEFAGAFYGVASAYRASSSALRRRKLRSDCDLLRWARNR